MKKKSYVLLKLNGITELNTLDGIVISDSGTILAPNLKNLDGVTAYLEGSDTQFPGSWTSFTGGSLTGIRKPQQFRRV